MNRLPVVLILPTLIQALSDSSNCPDLLDNPIHSHFPQGYVENATGISLTITNFTDFKDCVTACCDDKKCNAALTALDSKGLNTCWFVTCSTDSLCLPASQYSALEDTVLVLVHPSTPPWPNISVPEDRVCEDGLEEAQCKPGEVCRRRNSKSRNGVCRCDKGYRQSKDGCVAVPATTTPTNPVSTPKPERISIAVSVANKTIRLPVSEAKLTAFTVPGPTESQPFTYHWQAQTKLPGQESDANTETLRLSGLSEGVYIFKVSVHSATGSGEAMANVTVLPVRRVNRPPQAVILPPQQTVNLPTNKAVVDGSTSTDDSTGGDGGGGGPALTYAWSIASGPMGYQPKLPSVATLTLDNLIAGNYSIKLVVTDQDGATDEAVSALYVVPETDYPPKANAGEDKIIWLPQNSLILNGNKSSDDHEIEKWEWTKKKPEGEAEELPADITGARSPYLTVANLAIGIYTFELKVTDSAGQSKTDEVTVYVKPPSNKPPKAVAGEDQVLSLPLARFVLDGGLSSDDLNVTGYSWKQVKGPKPLTIKHPGRPVTNVTNLVPGEFSFELTVVDGSNNTDTDSVRIEIKQDSNQAPVARIKELGKLSMPVSQVILDGRSSSDDLGIESWGWERQPDSSAAGTIVGTANSSVLIISGLVDGIYSFNLKVVDGHGKVDTATTTFKIAPDPNKMAAVNLVVDKELRLLTQADLRNILDTIQIFVKSKSDVELIKLSAAARTGFATLVFRVTGKDGHFMKGSDVVAILKKTLDTNPDILGLPVLLLETSVCQNDCGGHGVCDEATRECRCQPFWIENVVSRRLFGGRPNCSWSLVYVVVAAVTGLAAVIVFYCCYCRFVGKKTKYSRLGDMELAGREVASDLISTDSESDSEEDILFDANHQNSSSSGAKKRGRKPKGMNGSAKLKSVA